jgi:hypothetical protein
VPFHRVAERVVVRGELLVVAAEAFLEPANERVSAGVVLPEILDRLLVHQVTPNPMTLTAPGDPADPLSMGKAGPNPNEIKAAAFDTALRPERGGQPRPSRVGES